jgi:hypothetical protein
MLTQVVKMPDQTAYQFALAVPEVREQFTFFFGSQQVGRKRRQGRDGSGLGGRQMALSPNGLHWGTILPSK